MIVRITGKDDQIMMKIFMMILMLWHVTLANNEIWPLANSYLCASTNKSLIKGKKEVHTALHFST